MNSEETTVLVISADPSKLEESIAKAAVELSLVMGCSIADAKDKIRSVIHNNSFSHDAQCRGLVSLVYQASPPPPTAAASLAELLQSIGGSLIGYGAEPPKPRRYQAVAVPKPPKKTVAEMKAEKRQRQKRLDAVQRR